MIALTGKYLTFAKNFQSGLSETEAPQQPQLSGNDSSSKPGALMQQTNTRGGLPVRARDAALLGGRA